MNNLDKSYQFLLKYILSHGIEKQDRTGTGTLSVFGWQFRHNMSEGFPLLTTKKMAWKSIVTELLWFLRGDTNIKFLLDYDCHIWDGDAYKNYLTVVSSKEQTSFISPDMFCCVDVDDSRNNIYRPYTQEEFINKIKTDDEFAQKWGELGPIYGKQWRNWKQKDILEWGYKKGEKNIDQIANLINDLKTNPDSRRLMVSAWNVGELDQMVLPPCHFSWQCYSHEQDGKRYLSLAWNQRSVDVGLGLPFNIASYALLLEIIAKEVGMIPYEIIGNLGDCHIYKNHIDGLKEQLARESYDLPSIEITEHNWYLHEKVKEHLGPKSFNDKIMSYRPDCFKLIDYKSHPTIKLPLSN